MTGRADQQRAPIFETLAGYARGGIYGFHTPGHKSGRFAAPELAELVGPPNPPPLHAGAREGWGLALDLPGMTATDNTFHPAGCIREAQELAAELFGAQATFYLTAGSTLGVAAALLATVPHGHTVALPRNIHRSVVAGLVLSGALPRFVPHEVLPECGALGVTPAALARALDADPPPAAVLLTRPSYYGLARRLDDIVELCHARRVPLIVDEAHGSHFRFLPDGPPEPALAAGADLAVQSWHKTLGSLIGSAVVHVGRESLIEPARVQEALNLLQTTSPSFLLLASLDVTRRWLWSEGSELFAGACSEAIALEKQICVLPGLKILEPWRDDRLSDHHRDPLRLVIDVSGSGWSGFDVERYLRTDFRIEDEMADASNVVYVLSPRDDPAARQRLLAGLRAVSEQPREPKAPSQEPGGRPSTNLLQPPIPPLAMPPRTAALARKTTVPFAAAAGRTCAEMVMFYPPGIPLLMPGELVTAETLDVCRQLLVAGAHPYASDATLATVRVVE